MLLAGGLVNEQSASVPVQHVIMKANEVGRSFAPDSLPLTEYAKLGAKEYTGDDEVRMFVRQMRAVFSVG